MSNLAKVGSSLSKVGSNLAKVDSSTCSSLEFPTLLINSINNNTALLILHPLSIDRSNAVASILTVKGLEGKPVIMMVKNPDLICKALGGMTLPKEMFLSYNDGNELLSYLKITCYIIIESLEEFMKHNLDKHLPAFLKTSAHLIFFADTYSLKLSDHQRLRNVYRTLPIHRIDLVDSGPTLLYQAGTVTLMTSEQTHSYESLSSKLNNSLTTTKTTDLMRIGNFLETEISPKLINLLNILLLNDSEKHILYTQFSNNIQLSKLLQHFSIPSVILTPDLTADQKKEKLIRFNESTPFSARVLVTFEDPIIELWNVANLHILEGVTISSFLSLLKRVYQRKLYSQPIENFKIYIHIAQKIDGTNAIDAEYYTKFAEEIQNYEFYFSEVWDSSERIGFNSTKGLVVIPN